MKLISLFPVGIVLRLWRSLSQYPLRKIEIKNFHIARRSSLWKLTSTIMPTIILAEKYRSLFLLSAVRYKVPIVVFASKFNLNTSEIPVIWRFFFSKRWIRKFHLLATAVDWNTGDGRNEFWGKSHRVFGSVTIWRDKTKLSRVAGCSALLSKVRGNPLFFFFFLFVLFPLLYLVH